MDERFKYQESNSLAKLSTTPSPPPSLSTSPSDKLSIELYQTLRPNLPAGQSLLAFSKTMFVIELPRHVGLSLACDLSMRALYLAHTAMLHMTGASLVKSRIGYGRALGELQLCVADPAKSRSTGTLCATLLLGICEQLLCADFTAAIRHAGGAARLIKAIGPRQFEEPFEYTMLHALQGAIVVESILYQQGYFLDSPLWLITCRQGPNTRITETPFRTLFPLLSRLPNLLFTFRESASTGAVNTSDSIFLHTQIDDLRYDLQAWRDTPAYTETFRTTTQPSAEFFEEDLIYTSNNAVSILCTYAATMILLNSALIWLSDSDSLKLMYHAESQDFATRICQSFECSREYSSIGSLAMGFAFRVAYLVPDMECRKWTMEKMDSEASLLGDSHNARFTVSEMESYFDYLSYC
ncbi:hypothetical protein MMC25_007359 [Agyrium rufum]|nr:hypothetical protein [Agyrium rufum]